MTLMVKRAAAQAIDSANLVLNDTFLQGCQTSAQSQGADAATAMGACVKPEYEKLLQRMHTVLAGHEIALIAKEFDASWVRDANRAWTAILFSPVSMQVGMERWVLCAPIVIWLVRTSAVAGCQAQVFT